jgi:hypothetical protein
MVLTLRSPPDCLCAVSSCRSSCSRNFTLICAHNTVAAAADGELCRLCQSQSLLADMFSPKPQ